MKNNNILICSYPHKTFYSSKEINKIISRSIKYPLKNQKIQNISDGGEGVSDLFKSNKFKKINIENTNMKKKAIKFKVLNQMAIIEVSDIIGGFEAKIKDGMYRTSYGIGSAIKKLYKKGIKKIIIGFGGSTVSDFGLGLAISLGVKFYDKNNNLICNKNNNFNAYSLKNIKKINLQNFFFKKKNLECLLLSDTNIKLLGSNGQVEVFAEQKGISGKNKKILKTGFENFKVLMEKKFQKKIDKKYMGAGGGTLAMIYCLFNSKLLIGQEYLSNKIKLEEKIKKSDLIISGEGCFDNSSKTKGIWKIIKISKKYKKKIILIVGKTKLKINFKNVSILKMFNNYKKNISKINIEKRMIEICKKLEV